MHKQSVKHSFNVPRLIWSSVVMIESENLENMFRFAKWRVIITSSRYDKYFKETITLYCDVRPDVQHRCLHAHDTHPPPLNCACNLWFWYITCENCKVFIFNLKIYIYYKKNAYCYRFIYFEILMQPCQGPISSSCSKIWLEPDNKHVLIWKIIFKGSKYCVWRDEVW